MKKGKNICLFSNRI